MWEHLLFLAPDDVMRIFMLKSVRYELHKLLEDKTFIEKQLFFPEHTDQDVAAAAALTVLRVKKQENEIDKAKGRVANEQHQAQGKKVNKAGGKNEEELQADAKAKDNRIQLWRRKYSSIDAVRKLIEVDAFERRLSVF